MIEELDGTGAVTASYVYGLDLSQSLQGAGGIGGILARVDHGADKVHLYFYDGNGNVGQLLDSSDGSVAAAYEYAPFGGLTSAMGSYAEINPFRFSSKYADGVTGLYYYGYRYYSPELGRWMSRDPIGEDGGINLYGFVNNDSSNQQDFLGLLRAVLYDDDFSTQADAQLDKWDKNKAYACEILVSYHVETITKFIAALKDIDQAAVAQNDPVNAMVFMFHGHPHLLDLGDGQNMEYLSANGERQTPKGNIAFPISMLPKVTFSNNAYIQLNTCRGGFPMKRGINIGEAFYNRYKVETRAFPYWIKYPHEHSSDVIPTDGSTLLYPRFGPVIYK